VQDVVDVFAKIRRKVPARLVLNLALAIFLGSLLGLGTALLLELMDQRVRGPEDLDQVAGAPLLGVIPASA
jgi:capsular polysaccharide biosynthesis protein